MLKTDLSKISKVADIEPEPKHREMHEIVNKTELQEHLQTSLEDGDLLDEDGAISGENVLTDEEEKTTPISSADDIELQKSSSRNLNGLLSTDDPIDLPSPQPTKISLKRKSSITSLDTERAVTVKEEPVPAAENISDTVERQAKVLELHPKPKIIKLSGLTLEERLQLRTKKFGIGDPKLSSLNRNSGSAVMNEVIPKHRETLKKRAERFGLENIKEEDLQQIQILKKRADRFGLQVSNDSDSADVASKQKEALQKRVERFGYVEPNMNSASSLQIETLSCVLRRIRQLRKTPRFGNVSIGRRAKRRSTQRRRD